MMALFTKVFVRTSSLLEALYTCDGVDGKLLFNKSFSHETSNTHNTNETSLASDVFRRPCEVPRLQTESSIFNITATSADGMDAFRAKPRISGLATELELPLFAVVCALSARC